MSSLNRLFRKRDLPDVCGLKRSQIDELVKLGQFPKPIRLSDGGRAVAWLENDLATWQAARVAARDTAPSEARMPAAKKAVRK